MAFSMTNTDGVVGTSLAVLVAAPIAGKERIVDLTFANNSAADVTYDLSRYDGTTHVYGFGNTFTIKARSALALNGIKLAAGRALWARASNASTLSYAADVIEQDAAS